MATQTQDTFLTGGRGSGGTIATINPASNGDTWTALQTGSTYSFNGSRASLTGSNSINLATLNNSAGRFWYSSVVVARFSKTNSADSVGLVARCSSSNAHYKALLVNNQLTISLVSGGTTTNLSSINFTDSGALVWIKFMVQGFGVNGAYNNLQAKIWLDGQSEPTNYMVFASDGALTTVGGVGFRIKANNNNTTQTIDSFSSVDVPPMNPIYNVTQQLPIGITYYFNQTNPNPIDMQNINDLAAWGNGVICREQMQWQAMELVQGYIVWDVLDDLVYKCNQAGIRICACLQGAPSWWCDMLASNGNIVAYGSGDLPDPTAFANYATAMATRYNGLNGYGFIEIYQIFNEECDQNSYTFSPGINRDVLGSRLATETNAVYPAIRAASPDAEIALGAVRKTPATALTHIINWMVNLFTGLNKTIQNIRLDGHYYRDGSFNPNPTSQNTDIPSAATEAATILSLAKQYGFPNATLMYGECGWNFFDDGSGVNGTLSAQVTGGTPITSLPANALAAAIPDTTPITLDYGNGTNQEICYAYGQANKNATTVQITSNPLGSGAAQTAFTPAHTHASASAFYAATLNVDTPAQCRQYQQSMYDVMRQHPRAYVCWFTMWDKAVVNSAVTPWLSNSPKSLTQIVNGVYTYMPGYFLAQFYMQNFLLLNWTPGPNSRGDTFTAPLLSSILTADALSATFIAPVP